MKKIDKFGWWFLLIGGLICIADITALYFGYIDGKVFLVLFILGGLILKGVDFTVWPLSKLIDRG